MRYIILPTLYALKGKLCPQYRLLVGYSVRGRHIT
jgi:hypothetical protein